MTLSSNDLVKLSEGPERAWPQLTCSELTILQHCLDSTRRLVELVF